MTLATLKRAEAALRAYAATFPGAGEAFPWGKSGGVLWIEESYFAMAPKRKGKAR